MSDRLVVINYDQLKERSIKLSWSVNDWVSLVDVDFCIVGEYKNE